MALGTIPSFFKGLFVGPDQPKFPQEDWNMALQTGREAWSEANNLRADPLFQSNYNAQATEDQMQGQREAKQYSDMYASQYGAPAVGGFGTALQANLAEKSAQNAAQARSQAAMGWRDLNAKAAMQGKQMAVGALGNLQQTYAAMAQAKQNMRMQVYQQELQNQMSFFSTFTNLLGNIGRGIGTGAALSALDDANAGGYAINEEYDPESMLYR